MRTKSSTISTTIIGLLCICAIGICTDTNNTSALTYQTKINNSFTISPSVSISLSSADLIIDNLAPGSSSDSNIVTLTVESNNPYGYTVSSTVGNDDQYPNADLKHQDSTASKVVDSFTSLSTTDEISNLDDLTAGNWGYSYNLNNTNWSNYSGLPLYNSGSAKELYTTSANNNSTIDFKIAASAKPQQIAGEYNNIINFIATVYPAPVTFSEAFADAGKETYKGYYKMQDMTPEICSTVELEESQTSLIDIRDDNVYNVAKLKDGRCWMVTNLDLPGGTTLYSETSSVPAGYPESGGMPYYTLPESSTIVSSDTSDPDGKVYNSGNHTDACFDSSPCYSYYSWTSATAGSGLGISATDNDALYSICPSGWKLPTSRSTAAGNSEFYRLRTAYGDSTGFLSNAGPGTIPNFLLSGFLTWPPKIGMLGDYWSSTVGTVADRAYALRINKDEGTTMTIADYSRSRKIAVRCIAKQ